MKTADITGLVKSFVDQGLLVNYIDDNFQRRRAVLEANPNKQNLGCMGAQITGMGKLHCQVMITVNEDQFDPIFRKEMRNFPGVSGGYLPTIIKIDMPDEEGAKRTALEIELESIFQETHPGLEAHIFHMGNDYFKVDLVSDHWRETGIFTRIKEAVRIISDKAPVIAENYITSVCPVTRAEYLNKKEDDEE